MVSFFNLGAPKQPEDANLPPAKRISTPAGRRLSTILENGNSHPSKLLPGLSTRASGTVSPLPEFAEEDASKDSQYTTTTSVWSDGEKLTGWRANKHYTKRGGWKRLALIVGLIIVAIIALAAGLAVGLKKKHSVSASQPSESQNGNPTSTTETPAAIASTLPSDFPLGSYSFVTFLDTSYTDCAANPSTWTCFPYTTYYTSPSSALAVFNWIISAKPGSPGQYRISSTDNPFSISFKNTDLVLEGAGTDSEHYSFRMSMTKMVSPSSNLTADNAATQCFFNQTTFQAVLYTRQLRTYPTDSIDVTGASYTQWPFRIRVEQMASGGNNVPNCYKLNNGNLGAQIKDGLKPQDEASLCSCLYKNWLTPT